MKWNIVAGQWSDKGVQAGDVEEKLRPAAAYVSVFNLTASLPIVVRARVLRNLDLESDIVRLSDGTKEVDLSRDTSSSPDGDLGVSCKPRGDDVPVDSINIEFRGHHDPMTDRGIVWVIPGDPGLVRLCIKSAALETSGMVTEIITAAEEAVREKVLSHFHGE